MKRFFLIFTVKLFIIKTFCLSVYENLLHSHYIPNSFVYLSDIDPTIIQDIRYAKIYNILGQSLEGYEANECILTKEAAKKLLQVQNEIKKFVAHSGGFLSLRIFDCYRPKVANEQIFYSLIQKKSHFRKLNFYPNLSEADIINFGIVELNSPHSRGSTVSVTLSATILTMPAYKEPYEFKIANCITDFDNRYMFDFGIDMGSNYNCFDKKSFANATLPFLQSSNRKLLKLLMENHGFVQSSKLNWWQFTLKHEPFDEINFNFPIKRKYRKLEPEYCQINTAKKQKKDSFIDLSDLEELAKKIFG